MVRCGVVKHPGDWTWSGYGELMGWRKRNRLLNQDKLLWLLRCGDVGAFRKQLDWLLEEEMINERLRREAKWSKDSAGVRTSYRAADPSTPTISGRGAER